MQFTYAISCFGDNAPYLYAASANDIKKRTLDDSAGMLWITKTISLALTIFPNLSCPNPLISVLVGWLGIPHQTHDVHTHKLDKRKIWV